MNKFSYLDRSNLEYIEEQYIKFLRQPDLIDSSMKLFFEGIEFSKNLSSNLSSSSISSKELEVEKLILHYKDYGHLKAHLDPLDLAPKDESSFKLENFGLSKSDLNKNFEAGTLIGLPQKTLSEIIAKLEDIYCKHLCVNILGCEPEVRSWFHKQIESGVAYLKIDSEKKKNILKSLIKAEAFERFLHTRYVGAKRFSIEGGDALMPMLEHSVDWGVQLNIENIVVGMAHRGRMNVLVNFMGQCMELILGNFEGNINRNEDYEGDVKYHIGYSSTKTTSHGKCDISLAFNPSHLEFISPVVCGMTRAKQRMKKDMSQRSQVMPILIHGDAAFIGQGVVSETLQLSQLEGYAVGGTVHIIINNQLGFTTLPSDARSTRYSSDVCKSIQAPVILVNGDDTEACIKAMHIAIEFRQKFHQDVVIDMICYRRYGHNESDEPNFTQPVIYGKIKNHPTLRKIYSDKLDAEKIMNKQESDKIYEDEMNNLQSVLEKIRITPPDDHIQSLEKIWGNLIKGEEKDFEAPVKTAVKKSQLIELSEILTEKPKNFNLHRKVARLLDQRKTMIKENKIDWGLAELLTYASLVQEGTPVRLSGQDCKRGTFSHRHAVYFDSETGEDYCPLKKIDPQTEFCIYNSSLSEMAVLGFEYGNSISDPSFLTVWEAQFGDFANGAQVIIDQFLSSGEQKWARYTGLTLLLPHGYEGQGPEHSSARLERFLQLCAQNNMIVCNLSTPANLFHALRRQMKRNFKRPLVIMSPKSLLRHPKVVSSLEDLSEGQFLEVIGDPEAQNLEDIETLILCSGKIYYDLEASLLKNKKTAIVRVEQFYPFPKIALTPYLNGYPELKKIIWTQEEPENMGAYYFIKPQLQKLCTDLGLRKIDIKYAGRTLRASPATGSMQTHKREQEEIIKKSLG